MLQRFRDRAAAVKGRNLPPIGGDERARFIEQAQNDFQDFAIIADATATPDRVATITVAGRLRSRRRRQTGGTLVGLGPGWLTARQVMVRILPRPPERMKALAVLADSNER